jgi:carboxymethylenebutenolidase
MCHAEGALPAPSGEAGTGGATSVFCVGFCYGGSQAWNQSAFDSRLAGCAGFYGRPDDCRPYTGRMSVPLLLLAAGQDFMTPAEDFLRFDQELAVEHEMVIYENAPHAFFDDAAGYDAECADAWRRLLAFVHAYHSPAEGHRA